MTLAQIAEISKETILYVTPVAFAVTAWRLKNVEKTLDELRKLVLTHLIPGEKTP